MYIISLLQCSMDFWVENQLKQPENFWTSASRLLILFQAGKWAWVSIRRNGHSSCLLSWRKQLWESQCQQLRESCYSGTGMQLLVSQPPRTNSHLCPRSAVRLRTPVLHIPSPRYLQQLCPPLPGPAPKATTLRRMGSEKAKGASLKRKAIKAKALHQTFTMKQLLHSHAAFQAFFQLLPPPAKSSLAPGCKHFAGIQGGSNSISTGGIRSQQLHPMQWGEPALLGQLNV